jgi:hypothetical protein
MQAVVVIHGMGEQRPMDTVKGFVKAVWETDYISTANGLPHPSQVWSRPDTRTGSLELRRITTRESIPSASFPHGVRTDFYELYWADLTVGSTWDEFTAWVGGLLLRRPKQVPRDLRAAWVALWIATLCILTITSLSVMLGGLWGVAWLNWNVAAQGRQRDFRASCPVHQGGPQQHSGTAKCAGARTETP